MSHQENQEQRPCCLGINRDHSVKVINIKVGVESTEEIERFLREYTPAPAFVHFNRVEIFDFGYLHFRSREDARTYYHRYASRILSMRKFHIRVRGVLDANSRPVNYGPPPAPHQPPTAPLRSTTTAETGLSQREIDILSFQADIDDHWADVLSSRAQIKRLQAQIKRRRINL